MVLGQSERGQPILQVSPLWTPGNKGWGLWVGGWVFGGVEEKVRGIAVEMRYCRHTFKGRVSAVVIRNCHLSAVFWFAGVKREFEERRGDI